MLNVCEMCIKQCVSKNKLYIVRLNTVWWARQITNVMFFSSFLLLKNSSILPLWICNIKCYCNALSVVKYCWIQIKNCKRLKIELISWMKSYCSENWSMFSGSQRRISIAPYKFYSCDFCIFSSSEHKHWKPQFLFVYPGFMLKLQINLFHTAKRVGGLRLEVKWYQSKCCYAFHLLFFYIPEIHHNYTICGWMQFYCHQYFSGCSILGWKCKYSQSIAFKAVTHVFQSLQSACVYTVYNVISQCTCVL